MKWIRFIVVCITLVALSANYAFAFSASLKEYSIPRDLHFSNSDTHYQKQNSNLFYFLEEDFLEENEESIEAGAADFNFIVYGPSAVSFFTPQFVAYQKLNTFVSTAVSQRKKTPLFIVYQVFRI
ncbi:MAG: hypothetical protein RLZZ65_1599 [Bacteroidota bacterium]